MKKHIVLTTLGVLALIGVASFLFFANDRVRPYLLAAVVGALGVVLLIFAPKWQIYRIRRNEETKGPLELENQYRQTLVQIFGGIAIIATVYSAFQNANIAQRALAQTTKNLELATDNYELARRGQVADRIFKAMAMLAEKNSEAKVAAVYALGQLAHEDPESQWTITETFFNYVRVNAHWESGSASKGNQRPADISAILDYMRTRPIKAREESGQKDRCFEYRQCIDYQKGERADPGNPEYYNIINLPAVDLSYAFLELATLKKAVLQDSDLQHARLRCAHLEDAYIVNSVLKYVEGSGAFLDKANLEGADLTCSRWNNARMNDIDLESAKLFGADLRGVSGLSKEVLAKAHGDSSTQLSDEKMRPTTWATTVTVCEKPASLETLQCPAEK